MLGQPLVQVGRLLWLAGGTYHDGDFAAGRIDLDTADRTAGRARCLDHNGYVALRESAGGAGH
jgi:hypothetical protein